MDELWGDYFQYLLWRCGLEKKTRFGRLFKILHHMDFTWVLERDENRDGDGYELRDDYEISGDFEDWIVDDFYSRRTSVFEVLIAIAIRIDNEFIGDPAEEHPEDFFLEMIKNLGLDRFVGNRYQESDVIKIVDRWLQRRFHKDGQGSPFPVKYDHRDQRKLEIWDQMNSYISENYV